MLSLLFQTKITIFYESSNNDNILHIKVFNSKFIDNVELYRTGNHYDLVYSEDKFETFLFSQNIIFDVIF